MGSLGDAGGFESHWARTGGLSIEAEAGAVVVYPRRSRSSALPLAMSASATPALNFELRAS